MSPYMTNRLGEILVHKGFITSEQLYAAIKEQKKHRQRLACLSHTTQLKQQPLLLTTACAAEIQRAHCENQHHLSPYNLAISPSKNISDASNDSRYDQD